MSDAAHGSSKERFEVDGVRLYSVRQINSLPEPDKERIYRHLLPTGIITAHGIDPDTLCDAEGVRLVAINCPEGSRVVEIDIRPSAGFVDPLFYLELADTRLNQIQVLLWLVNDPSAERFETDRDWRGERTEFGTLSRNIPEEVRALEAGLAPGQVRKGLRLSRSLQPIFESFVQRLSHDYYLMEPLAYHNAILFERLGFNYVQGRRKMQWINEAFQPGGRLHAALDDSTPFRAPDAWLSVRGRSWAIHDEILGQPWHGVRMYKRVGKHAGVDTFPGGPY